MTSTPTSPLPRDVGRTPTITLHVASGIHMVTHASTNCFLVEAEDGVTLVDAAYLSTWPAVRRCLSMLGRPAADVRGLVLTGGGNGHDGYARLVRRCYGVPVWVREGADKHRRHTSSSRRRALAAATHPRAWPVLRAMAAQGAWHGPSLVADHHVTGHTVLPLPGRPHLVPLPDGSAGDCLVHLPDRGTVLTGRALVTFDPATALQGPRFVGAGDEAALDTIRALRADTVLPRFGLPWTLGTERAVDLARAA